MDMDKIADTLDGSSQPALVAIEKTIATVWSSELAVDAVAAEDDFFALGGDSLKMLTVLFRIGQAIGVEVTPEALYVNPTLGQFSKAVEGLLADQSSPQRLETGTI